MTLAMTLARTLQDISTGSVENRGANRFVVCCKVIADEDL
jgi:hypothetical protein